MSVADFLATHGLERLQGLFREAEIFTVQDLRFMTRRQLIDEVRVAAGPASKLTKLLLLTEGEKIPPHPAEPELVT